MPLEIAEKFLINNLQKAVRQRKGVPGNISSKHQSSIGFAIGHFITDLLDGLTESNINGKWIDAVQWMELRLIGDNKFTGYGFIWWGFTEDETAETFPDKFFCNMEIKTLMTESISYFFQFQLDRKNYELTNR